MVSFGQPDSRLFHLKRSHLRFDNITVRELQRQTDDCVVTHYVYICRKGEGAEKVLLNWTDEKQRILEDEGLDSDFSDKFSECECLPENGSQVGTREEVQKEN